MADESPQSALVPVDKEGAINVYASEALDPRQGGGQIWCSLVPTNDAERVALHKAFVGQVPRISTIPGQTINVTNIGRQAVTMVDSNTGEIVQGVRTILFTDDGKLYSCVSEGIGKSLGMIFRLWKQPPWNPPLPLIMREMPVGGGKRFYYVEVDEQAFAKGGKRK